MRYLSVFIFLQGLSYVYISIVDLYKGVVPKFVTIQLSPIVYQVGIALGMLFVLTGLGMWFKKKYSYYLTLSLYAFMSIYLLVVLVMLSIEKAWVLMFVISLFLLLFVNIFRYTQKNIGYFN